MAYPGCVSSRMRKGPESAALLVRCAAPLCCASTQFENKCGRLALRASGEALPGWQLLCDGEEKSHPMGVGMIIYLFIYFVIHLS